MLFLLFLINLSNYMDRTIINTVGQAIKAEFHLTDAQLGMLGGPAFSVFFALVALPIARLAERFNRVNILSIGLFLWSTMTALAGLATGLPQLLAARLGLGAGEATYTPSMQSITADYVPYSRRATAMAVTTPAIPVGALLGALAGGWVTQHYGWRAAFFIVGIPGVILALVFRLVVKEPPRGRFDPALADTGKIPSIWATLKHLFGRPTYCLIAIGSSISNMAWTGINLFSHPYLVRQFHVGYAEAAVTLALVNGIAGVIGAYGGGVAADWLGQRDVRWYTRLPAIGFLLACPFYILALQQPTWQSIALFLAIPAFLRILYEATLPALVLNMSEIRMRASSAAISSTLLAIISFGLGPLVLGFLSDHFAAQAGHGASAAATCAVGVHGAAAHAVAGCRQASAEGLKTAMMVCSGFTVIGGIMWLLAGRTVGRDMVGHPQAFPSPPDGGQMEATAAP